MSNIEKAKELLKAGNYTCVLYKDGQIFTSFMRGVAPMLEFIDNGTDLRGFSAADRVIGKAAAMLFCHAGVTEVYADVMSNSAAEFLSDRNIVFSYGVLCDKIINRKGDGICPMELATADISDTNEAICAIHKRLAELRKD